MTAMIAIACPACGAVGGPWLFFIIFGTFVLMFGGTILLFFASWARGEWNSTSLRWSAIESEYSPKPGGESAAKEK